MTITLRAAREADVRTVIAIEAASFAQPWPESAFRHELTNDVAVFTVAVDGEVVVGYYNLWRVADEGHLLNIVVAPGRRRTGLGRRLLDDAITVARDRGAANLFLEVRPSNAAALALYLQFGFRKALRRRRYYEDGEDAYVLVKTL